MVTRAQKEDIANHVRDAVSILLQDEKFITVLAEKVSANLKPLFEHQMNLNEHLEEKVREVTQMNRNLRRRINFLENAVVKNTVRIIGIEDVDEKPEDVVNNLFNNVLKLNISSNSIDTVYHVKYKNNGKNDKQKRVPEQVDKRNTFIVKFVNHKDKQLVLHNRKNLKSTGIKIYEELSQDTMALYKRAVVKYPRQDVWTFGGSVYAKIDGSKKKLGYEDFMD